jgi:signal transduction histidine kinase
MNSAIAELANTELFKDVPESILRRVVAHTEQRQLSPGEILLTPERPNQHVYVLLSGALSLHFDSAHSPEVRELTAGVSVGEMSTIDDAPPSAYLIAKQPSRVLPIHRDVMQQLVADSSAVARNLLRLMGQWLKSNSRHIANDQSQIQRLTATIRHVTAQGLDQRIPAGPEDRDFTELIAVFNQMLERLERGFKQASRFSGDAAHELKTPLAILQGRIEQAIHQAEAGSPVQIMLADILDEVRRLSSIAKKLLLLSHADAGRLGLHRVNFNVSELLMDLCEDARMLAPELRLTAGIAPGISMLGDADLIRQALNNMVTNAIKYNLEAGWITITAISKNGHIDISITNASDGISAADQTRIFERFYRADPARSRNIEGSGLGLSLAREIARAHGGDLTLENTALRKVCFLLVLPSNLKSTGEKPGVG